MSHAGSASLLATARLLLIPAPVLAERQLTSHVQEAATALMFAAWNASGPGMPFATLEEALTFAGHRIARDLRERAGV